MEPCRMSSSLPGWGKEGAWESMRDDKTGEVCRVTSCWSDPTRSPQLGHVPHSDE